MSRPDGGGPLPALQEAVLDDAALDALVGDVLALTELLEVRVKQAAAAHSGAAPTASGSEAPGLPDAMARLRAGEASAVQLRYAHEGRVWIDTLTRTDAGIRLVRIEVPRR